VRAPTAADLLDAWERGQRASPGERGLLLLALAEPGHAADELAGWSAGRRDAALLTLRERAFGAELEALAACPSCEEPLELQFAVSDVLVGGGAEDELAVEVGGRRVAFRLPSAGDLAELGGFDDPAVAERWLLERCVAGAAELSPDALDAVSARMAEADPQADVELACECPACGASWSAPLDVVAFLWREIDARGRLLLGEVAALAAAYGWAERDILAMSAWRRSRYLELVGG
jgi:hypothetical protein